MDLAPTIKLNNGKTIPHMGLGFYAQDLSKAVENTYQALEIGYRLFDTAKSYGNEKEAAEGIAKWIEADPEHHERGDVFYSTKIFDTDHGYEQTKKALEAAYQKAAPLGYIDMVLIHSPQSNYEKRHGTWLALQEAVESGRVKNIGVSNYGIPHLKELFAYPDLKIKPVINQIELHPWFTKNELVKFCEDNNIVCEAYAPLAKAKRMDDPDLIRLGEKYSKTPAQILIRWSTQMGFIPVPMAMIEEQLRGNLDVFDFELTVEEVKQLSDKNEDFIYCWGGKDPVLYPLDK